MHDCYIVLQHQYSSVFCNSYSKNAQLKFHVMLPVVNTENLPVFC